MKKDQVLLQKLVQDRVAFAGFLIVFIVILVGIFAPFLLPIRVMSKPSIYLNDFRGQR